MQPIASLWTGRISNDSTGGSMLSKLTVLVFLAMGTVLTGASVANAQLPSGERQLGKTIIEPGYDDRTGELIYVMTPMGAPFPSHNNQHAVSPLFLIVYPSSAAASVGKIGRASCRERV